MQQDENKSATALLTLLALGIVRFFSVPQGFVRFVTAFGKFRRKCDPGLGRCNWLWGLYEKPTRLLPVMEQVFPLASERVFTRDGVLCKIESVVFFRLDDTFKAAFEVQDYERGIEGLVQATLRNECGNLAARELLSGRQKLADRLREQLDKDTAPWGVAVRLVEITGIEMSVNDPKRSKQC
jgi:regulator of protease activity HflC (stomatin/prohibitin superfamily)